MGFRLTQARVARSAASDVPRVSRRGESRAAEPHDFGPEVVRDTAIGRAFSSDLANCLGQFRAPGGDPDAILPTLYNPQFPIVLEPTLSPGSATIPYRQGSRLAPNGIPTIYGGSGKQVGSVIQWNPFDVSPYIGSTVLRDPCASLYHELYHAYQNATASTDNRNFPGTKIPTREVLAVRAENDWRSRHGLPLRTSYATGWPYQTLAIPLPLTMPPRARESLQWQDERKRPTLLLEDRGQR